MKLFLIVLTILSSMNISLLNCQNQSNNNIFYPQSELPVENLNVFYEKNFSTEEMYTLYVVSGVLSKRQPIIYIRENKDISQQDIWLNEMKDTFKVNFSYDLQGTSGLVKIIKQNLSMFKGIFLYDPTDNQQRMAVTSLCGIYNGLPIDKNNSNLINEFKDILPVLRDCSNPPINPQSIFDEWKNHPSHSTRVGVYIDPDKSIKFLVDYAAFTGGFYFQDKLENELTDNVFNELENNAGIFGWGSEGDLVSFSSKRNKVVHAADYSQNLNVSSNLNKKYMNQIREKYISKVDNNINIDKKQEEKDILIKKNEMKNSNKHTVCFLMSDGDNLQWLQNAFLANAWFGHPNRGQIPVAWTVSSSIVDLLPEIYTYLIRHKSENDYFVSAPSGEGYTFPNLFTDHASYMNKMQKFLEKFGMRTLNILDSQQNPRKEVVQEMSKFTDAIFYYPYDNYAGWKGKIEFVNDKTVVIGGRHRLWSDFNGPQQLADKLNSYSNDINSNDGYSLIPVHVWSEDYGKVIETYNLLDKEKVEVLGLNEFVRKVLDNVKH